MVKKELLNLYKDIENEFFELDHEKKIALMKLHFSKVSDIFDTNSLTKQPIMSDDFLDWIKSAFDYAPKKYKIDIDISFDDLEDYSEEELEKLFLKNVFLEVKKSGRDMIAKNKIALNLIVLGLIFLVTMILITSLWKDGGVIKEIISYIMDIACTVTIWEALTILIIDNKEKREYRKNLMKKFDKIIFHKTQEN